MRKYLSILTVLCLSLLVSCNKTDTVEPAGSDSGPFANGSNKRDMIVVISDLHLGANLAYAEINKNLAPLENLLSKVRASKNVKELVIAGDLIDEWFVPANLDTYNGKGQSDYVQRIAATNKGVLDAFNRIIQDGNILVTYVPGNHDLTITAANIASILPGINQARDNVQGLGAYSPAGHPEMIIEHGHRYNFFCAPDPISNKDIAPGSIMPPGYFFTRIAALHVAQGCKTPGDSILAAVPNASGGDSQNLLYAYWKVWEWTLKTFPITNKFSDKIITTNIDGFTQSLSVNDLVPYQNAAGGVIDVKMYKGIQDNWDERQKINKVAVNIPAAHAIQYAADPTDTDNQAFVQYFTNPNSDKRLVVFGHSHIAKIIPTNNFKGQKSIYANTGAWIDRNPGGTTTNFVVITPQSTGGSSQTLVKLYNYAGEVVTKMAEDSFIF
ncbi:MAG: metallophosphoesterase [Bacteroidota bacterium]|nr:metallophosphoesterase [Bacteroidota bacterium]